MIKTEKYQFNLVEKKDAFSPEPLNENMEKVEKALTDGLKAEAAARQEADAALGRRLDVLELKHFAAGTIAAAAGTSFELGFTPAAVIVIPNNSSYNYHGMAVTGHPALYGVSHVEAVIIVEGGFLLGRQASCFSTDNRYHYIAIA